MVDYSVVKVDCPSIAFFFAHLGSLLESIEGEYLERISFFVGEDYLYTMSFLHYFLWFPILLR